MTTLRSSRTGFEGWWFSTPGVVDAAEIGANLGLTSCVIARTVFIGCLVYALHPRSTPLITGNVQIFPTHPVQ